MRHLATLNYQFPLLPLQHDFQKGNPNSDSLIFVFYFRDLALDLFRVFIYFCTSIRRSLLLSFYLLSGYSIQTNSFLGKRIEQKLANRPDNYVEGIHRTEPSDKDQSRLGPKTQKKGILLLTENSSWKFMDKVLFWFEFT